MTRYQIHQTTIQTSGNGNGSYGYSAREVVEREAAIVYWEIDRTVCIDRDGHVQSQQDTLLRGWDADGTEYAWRCHDGGDLGGEVTVSGDSLCPRRIVRGVTYSPDDRLLDLDADTGELVYHDDNCVVGMEGDAAGRGIEL